MEVTVEVEEVVKVKKKVVESEEEAERKKLWDWGCGCRRSCYGVQGGCGGWEGCVVKEVVEVKEEVVGVKE